MVIRLCGNQNKRNFFLFCWGWTKRRNMYINIKKLTTALILTGSVQAGHKIGNAVLKACIHSDSSGFKCNFRIGHKHTIQIAGIKAYNLDFPANGKLKAVN